MKRWLLLLATMCLALPARSQQGDEPEYNPPARGAPGGRVGGGSRGLEPPLAALAPDHTGLTISAQPALYYYLPVAAGVRVVLRSAADPNLHPLIEKDLAPPAKNGIQRLDLKTLGVTLQPGVEYRWTVSAGQRSDTAMIQRVAISNDLARKLNGVPTGRSRYTLLAGEGVWYDAFDEVSRTADTGSAVAGRHRAALLEQVGLKQHARHERLKYE